LSDGRMKGGIVIQPQVPSKPEDGGGRRFRWHVLSPVRLAHGGAQ
jgi:hypothetical protein